MCFQRGFITNQGICAIIRAKEWQNNELQNARSCTYVCIYMSALATYMSCIYIWFNTNKSAFNIFGTTNSAYFNVHVIIFSIFGYFQAKFNIFLQSRKVLKARKISNKQKLHEAQRQTRRKNIVELSITSADIYFQISELINKHCVWRISHIFEWYMYICNCFLYKIVKFLHIFSLLWYFFKFERQTWHNSYEHHSTVQFIIYKLHPCA